MSSNETQARIDSLYELHSNLENKGDEYRYAAHVVNEIAEYLNGERSGLQLIEQTFQPIIENKTLTEIVDSAAATNYRMEVHGVSTKGLLTVVMPDKVQLESLRNYLLDDMHGLNGSDIEQTNEPITHDNFADWLNS